MIDVTFLISTHNRGQVLLDTLGQIARCGLPASRFETIVVDNASTDSGPDLVAHWFPHVKLIRLTTNEGPCAKNHGLPIAGGQFIVFLDDDSFPAPGAITRMIEHFDRNPTLGAATFTITLPSGQRECSAYPNVFIGCGTGFRHDALRQVGGLPADFFMAAEEYDLSLRLLDTGWDVRPFGDLHVTHLKTPAARYPERIASLDVRNNLLLIARRFPAKWVLPFAWDWTKRYRLIAAANGRRRAHWRGVIGGIFAMLMSAKRRAVSDKTFEIFTKLDETEQLMRRAVEQRGAKRVLFVDLGKNSLAYHRAAKRLGLTVVAIADAKLGGRGFRYHGKPIIPDDAAAKLMFDAVIISNTSPVHAEQRRQQWRTMTDRPVIDLFEVPTPESPAVAMAA